MKIGTCGKCGGDVFLVDLSRWGGRACPGCKLYGPVVVLSSELAQAGVDFMDVEEKTPTADVNFFFESGERTIVVSPSPDLIQETR